MQAFIRNREVVKSPDIRFLHGGVAYATCDEHDILGIDIEGCPFCNKRLKKGSLFYPDEDKDYTKDKLIQRDWNAVTQAVKEALHLTIYGYSGPVTDFNARKLLIESWRQNKRYDINYVEIIDIKDREEIRNNWQEFFPHYHNMIHSDFWESSIAYYPRRTAEWKYNFSVTGKPSVSFPITQYNTLFEVQEWFMNELVKYESEKGE